MTRIWTKNRFLDDDKWGYLSDGAQYVSVADVKESKEQRLAVRLEVDDTIEGLAPFLAKIDMIAVHFPAFNDGRAFSHASLLRDRFGFKGEIRAFGQILLDQIPLMLRCGITSFEINDEATIRHLDAQHIPAINHHYQPSINETVKSSTYSWRYRAR